LLTGMPVGDENSAELAAREILKQGVKIVIVTLGSRGALIVTESQVIQVGAFKVDVLDTTAAGDAFIGGFAAKLLAVNAQSVDFAVDLSVLEGAVRYGCACGALAATKLGAQPSLPSKADVAAFMQ
ncbi:MAG TPA: PfkB family carbohydrate kinase, partial [Anaerolineales bacterium]|nr:PfkB family carbohydrate kinase [Anaerolineales bacterium]